MSAPKLLKGEIIMPNLKFFENLMNTTKLTDANGKKFIIFDKKSFFSNTDVVRTVQVGQEDALIEETFLNGTSYICKRLCSRMNSNKYYICDLDYPNALPETINELSDTLKKVHCGSVEGLTTIYFMHKNPEYNEDPFDYDSAFKTLSMYVNEYFTNRSQVDVSIQAVFETAWNPNLYTFWGDKKNKISFNSKVSTEKQEDNLSDISFEYKSDRVIDESLVEPIDKYQKGLYTIMKNAVKSEDFNTVYKLINFAYNMIDLGSTVETARKKYMREK